MFQEFCPPTPTKNGKIKYCKRSKDGEHCWDWRISNKTYWEDIEWYCVECGKIEDKIRWMTRWERMGGLESGQGTVNCYGVDIMLYCLLSKV